MYPSPSSPSPLFRLSHLTLALDSGIDNLLLDKILVDSTITLISLTIHNFGYSLSTADAAVDLFFRISLPALLHLAFVRPKPAFFDLLPLLPSLTSLSLDHLIGESTLDTVFTRLASAAPPALSVLEVRQSYNQDYSPSLPIRHLIVALSSPSNLQSLRQLRLPGWFCHGDKADWGNLEAQFRRRSLELIVT